MTDRELKKLSRAGLLEILLTQSKEIDRLRAEIDELNEKLDDRDIVMRSSGSIAEASLKINGVFEAAQKAADQYVNSVKYRFLA
ncbi:MAG: DNA repair protein [Ruminococcus sp.]|nr:DNA repair protein [Ruminococcus sp.]